MVGAHKSPPLRRRAVDARFLIRVFMSGALLPFGPPAARPFSVGASPFVAPSRTRHGVVLAIQARATRRKSPQMEPRFLLRGVGLLRPAERTCLDASRIRFKSRRRQNASLRVGGWLGRNGRVAPNLGGRHCGHRSPAASEWEGAVPWLSHAVDALLESLGAPRPSCERSAGRSRHPATVPPGATDEPVGAVTRQPIRKQYPRATSSRRELCRNRAAMLGPAGGSLAHATFRLPFLVSESRPDALRRHRQVEMGDAP